jgi:hypothetical protein
VLPSVYKQVALSHLLGIPEAEFFSEPSKSSSFLYVKEDKKAVL